MRDLRAFIAKWFIYIGMHILPDGWPIEITFGDGTDITFKKGEIK